MTVLHAEPFNRLTYTCFRCELSPLSESFKSRRYTHFQIRDVHIRQQSSDIARYAIALLCWCICSSYSMPSRDLHEGMFDKPEGVARGFITHSRVFFA